MQLLEKKREDKRQDVTGTAQRKKTYKKKTNDKMKEM